MNSTVNITEESMSFKNLPRSRFLGCAILIYGFYTNFNYTIYSYVTQFLHTISNKKMIIHYKILD